MGKQSRIKAKRRELRSYVETRAITPGEANEAMRRAKGRGVDRTGIRKRFVMPSMEYLQEAVRNGYAEAIKDVPKISIEQFNAMANAIQADKV
jgi:hypothetical protein